jgi:hypothetical protein
VKCLNRPQEGPTNRLNFAYKVFGLGSHKWGGAVFRAKTSEAGIFLEPGLPGGCFRVATSNIFGNFLRGWYSSVKGGLRRSRVSPSGNNPFFMMMVGTEAQPKPGLQTWTGAGPAGQRARQPHLDRGSLPFVLCLVGGPGRPGRGQAQEYTGGARPTC